jgi:hypothetical protein
LGAGGLAHPVPRNVRSAAVIPEPRKTACARLLPERPVLPVFTRSGPR